MTVAAEQAAFAATLVDEWVRAGVAHAVVSPGSRSTPLVLALGDAADRGALRLHVRLDERSAAFFALGIGLSTSRPAVVVTTSGTAAAELTPAVVEAHHGRVPLIACTADRPPDLHDVGAPQTIDQRRLFDGLLRWRCDPGPADAIPRAAWRSLAARVVVEATVGPVGPGPVHANLAFREPFLDASTAPSPAGRAGSRPWHEVVVPPTQIDAGPLADRLAARRGLIVAGGGAGDPEAVESLGAALRWPVLADPRSGCRGRSGAVAAFDSIVRSEAWASARQPEVALRLGAPPASKALASWLASVEQVIVDPWAGWADPERAAAVFVRADPSAVCRALAAAVGGAEEEWAKEWMSAERSAQAAIEETLGAHERPTEPAVARALTSRAELLVVSSSMPVRDVEWFGHPNQPGRVLANRGANGIDGVVSTALGVAATAPATALVGDLAFLHDAGALLGAEGDLTIVVVDNDGGGIFSFLPQADLDPARFERFFGTPHHLDLTALASAHGLPVREVLTAEDLVLALEPSAGVRVVVVRTDRRANVAVHHELNAAVAAALA